MKKLMILQLPLFFFTFFLTAQTSIIPFGTTWKYLDNGSNQGTAWRSTSFSDAAWKSGAAELGYGDGDEATTISYGKKKNKKNITAYFRKTISISDASLYKNYTLNLVRDDGAVVYVNGTEVYRTNMPAGTISYTTLASSDGNGGKPPLSVTLPVGALVTGTNVIAVEIHIYKATSPDLSFNLELIGNTATTDQTPPTVSSINRQSPTANPTNATSVTYRATFSEKVSGVDASDFALTLVSGTVSGTISSVTAVGTAGTTYDISVTSISGNGTIRLDLKASGTGITDASSNAITGGYTAGQTYTIDQIRPTVSSVNRQSPTTQTTSATSVTYRTTFSEKVSGVDAADFTLTTVSGTATGSISGVAAAGTAGTTYDVTVSSITGSGDIRLDLKGSGTGITDAAGNAISGGFTSGQVYTIQAAVVQPGFTSITNLTPVSISDKTADKPQAKVWTYAGKWWCVLPSSGATKIFRLDGTSWTPVLTLASSNSRPDYWMVGGVVHFLLYKGSSSNSLIVSAEYDATNNTYKLWSQRPTSSTLLFPAGSQIATLAVDGNGRMWVASDGTSEAYVWWSDAPYTSFSAPITIATGITDDDMCAVTALPGKIGFFWSNQNTGLFGFKTHSNGSSPTTWSADEVPASQSAISGLPRMADNHMHLVVASDGTLYCAAKTSYNAAGYPQLILLVRRSSGSWDNLYPVTINEGTQPIVILNEALGKIKVIYTTATNGGDIVYRESSTSSISFSAAIPLFSGGGNLYHFATSTHQTYNPDVVILATNLSTTPYQAVGVLASDGGAAPITAVKVPAAAVADHQALKAGLMIYPNPFSGYSTVNFTLSQSDTYTLTLQDSRGRRLALLGQGWAAAGVPNTVRVEAGRLASGLYLVSLQTSRGSQTIKLLVNK